MMKKWILFLVPGLMVVALALAILSAPVAAQGPMCQDPNVPGNLIPCPQSGGQPGKPTSVHNINFPTPCGPEGSGLSARPICTPTPVPCITGDSGLSAQLECTATPPPCTLTGLSALPECTPTPKSAALLIPGGGAGGNGPNGDTPAIQNPDQGSSPFNLPGPLGMLIALLIIVVCIIGGLFIARRRRLVGGSNQSGPSPAIDWGDKQNFTITVKDANNLDGQLGNLPAIQRGSTESATVSIHDVNDIPNIGDKTGGGTL